MCSTKNFNNVCRFPSVTDLAELICFHYYTFSFKNTFGPKSRAMFVLTRYSVVTDHFWCVFIEKLK